jgi:alkanesulfonate monooxygenase SsuD/methylene tetrahydromethanopterin reductase-like flavin-dependent oxidoreductase (luciferase family)
MKFDIVCLPTVPAQGDDRTRLRPIGRNRHKVQEMYQQVIEVCVAAEAAGFDAFSTTEHHFHTEGFELAPAPVVLYSHLAAICDRIAFAPLGMVLTTWDPIRLAEELAVLDHLSRGRLYVGLARGYQPRWTDIMGQHYSVQGATMDGSAVDEHNREVFEEMLDILLKAWTCETFDYDGKFYKVPAPRDGITWPVHELTRQFGAPDELNEDGKVVKIGVVPGPYQTPHPPLWQGYAASQKTVLRCARMGITPFLIIAEPEMFRDWCVEYQAVAASVGRALAVGEGVGASRSVTFGDRFEEAYELGVRTTGAAFEEYFAKFGFMEAFRRPTDPPTRDLGLQGPREVFQRLLEGGFAICGTPDDVTRGVEQLSRCHGDGQLEWFSWNLFQQGYASRDVYLRQIELFEKHVIKEFSE